MLDEISGLWQSFINAGIRDTPTDKLPFIAIMNTSAAIPAKNFTPIETKSIKGRKIRRHHLALKAVKVASENERVAPRMGLLPAEATFRPIASDGKLVSAGKKQTIQRLAYFFQGQEKIYAGMAPQSRELGNVFPAQTLAPWHNIVPVIHSDQADGARQKRELSEPFLPRNTTGEPALPNALAEDIVHLPGDSEASFCQQAAAFFNQMDLMLDREQQQQLVASLGDSWMVFSNPSDGAQRYKRAHEDVMRWRIKQHQMTIKNKSMNNASIGAKITRWSDEITEQGRTLFIKGTSSYNPGHFLLSGGAAVLGFFSRKVGETVTGEIFERQPGQSRAEFVLEWGMAVSMMPEAQANKAFNPPRVKPSSRLVNSLAAVKNPITELPGTVVNHAQTGLTVHTILEKNIAGQQWRLYPDDVNRGMAERVGSNPVVKYPATRNSQNNAWQIKDIEGEHVFTYSKQSEFYLKVEDSYHPLTHNAADATWVMSSGKKIYFNQLNSEWREFYPANTHLNGRVLSAIPQALINSLPGERRVLSPVAGWERQVWATQPGEHYLGIKSRGRHNPNNVEIGYVRGNLEGDFFTLGSVGQQSISRQTVLKWQPMTGNWDVVHSPFSLLQKAEAKIDRSWLQQNVAAPGWLNVADNIPGLYWNGKSHFLRWNTAADGTVQYLPVRLGKKPGEYFPEQPVADDMLFRYSPQVGEWQFQQLKNPVFYALPAEVKVRPTEPFSLSMALEDYHDIYRSSESGDLYIHTGTDHKGTQEYIRVEQDAEQSDLFSLRVPNSQTPDGADDLYVYRLDENEEFVLEEIRPCQLRVKRAGDEFCAGPSGINKPSGSGENLPAAKKNELEIDYSGWLYDHPRVEQETVRVEDEEVMIKYRNMVYAVRLSGIAPKTLPLNVIATHAEVSLINLRAELRENQPQVAIWLASNPRHRSEQALNYALRLCRIAPEGISITAIADHTKMREFAIISWLKTRASEAEPWFEQYPQQQGEGDLDYATRLYHLRGEGITLSMIANRTEVKKSLLEAQVKRGSPKILQWLSTHPRKAQETDGDYALRLLLIADNGVSLANISAHTNVREVPLRKRFDRVNAKTRQFLRKNVRHENETDMDYAARLHQLRQAEVEKDEKANNNDKLDKANKVENKYLAIYAGVPLFDLRQRVGVAVAVKTVTAEQHQWFANYPRIQGETGKEYALRLLQKRDEPNMAAVTFNLNITKMLIAEQAGIDSMTLSRALKKQNEMREWFNANLRLPQEEITDGDSRDIREEKNKQYGLRLVNSRNLQQEKVAVLDGDIANHIGVSAEQLKGWLNRKRFEWFNSMPRIPEEMISEQDSSIIVERKNQLYGLRMIEIWENSQHPDRALITLRDIAAAAKVTKSSLYDALNPEFLGVNPLLARPYDPETGWAPEYGLLHLNLQQNPPLLTDPINPALSITQQILGDEPLTITNANYLLNAAQIKKVDQRVATQQRWLGELKHIVETDGKEQNSYIKDGVKVDGVLNEYLEVLNTLEADNPVGLSVIARKKIPRGTLLGIYTGVRHNNDATLRTEFRKVGTQQVLKYLWGDMNNGQGSTSSYQNANILSLVNTGKMYDLQSLGDNNLVAGYLNDKVVFYVAKNDIEKGNQLLISYGKHYNPDYGIQTTLNNDIIRIIARSNQCYFSVYDVNNNVRIIGPEGPLDAIPEQARSYFLKETTEKSGVLKYNVMKDGKVITARLRNGDENNLYRAMAVAMQNGLGEKATEEAILNMKASVKAEYPNEEGAMKPEPV